MRTLIPARADPPHFLSDSQPDEKDGECHGFGSSPGERRRGCRRVYTDYGKVESSESVVKREGERVLEVVQEVMVLRMY